MIHLEGMGVIGSLLAWRLEQQGIPFTWSDTEQTWVAWRACTGAVYPSGDPGEQADLVAWYDWHTIPPWPFDVTELGVWTFTSKNPPHGSKAAFEPIEPDPWKQSLASSVHLNAQTLVIQTRSWFTDRRSPAAERGDRVVVTHGFSQRLTRYVWGWAAPVRINSLRSDRRRALYHRRSRFYFAYAYPIPGTDLWWAGSSLVVQKTPHPLDLLPRFSQWQRTMAELGVHSELVGEITQGWRPRGDDDDPEVIERDGRLLVRPHWHDGVRRGPAIVDAVMEALA